MASKTSQTNLSEQGKLWLAELGRNFLEVESKGYIWQENVAKKAKPRVEIVTYLTPGNLIVSSATSVSFKDAGGGWDSSRKRTMTYIVVKRGQRHKKWKVKWRKVCNILNFLLVSAGFSWNDRNNPFCFAIALETLWMTVHAANTDIPN